MNRIPFVSIVLVALFALSPSAEAHAFLRHAEPRTGSRVAKAPPEVVLSFSEPIEPAFSSVKVLASSGREVDKRDAHIDRHDKSELDVSLPKLVPGIYRVVWRVVSADTHVMKGDFKFAVSR